MIAKLYALGGLLVLAGVVSADVCHAPAQVYAPAYVPAYVAPATIVLPLYGASYADADPETALALQAILEELKAMRQEIAGLRSAGPPPQAALKVDPVKVLAAHCAACHTPGPNLKGEFEIFDGAGKPLKLNGPDRRAIEKRVREGTMPPPEKGKLAADDRAAVVAFVGAPPAATPAKLPPAKK